MVNTLPMLSVKSDLLTDNMHRNNDMMISGLAAGKISKKTEGTLAI